MDGKMEGWINGWADEAGGDKAQDLCNHGTKSTRSGVMLQIQIWFDVNTMYDFGQEESFIFKLGFKVCSVP